MATKKVNNKPEGNQAVGEAVSGVESWLKKNGNLISTIVLVILLAVCAILALNRWVFKPAQQEAKAAAAGADRYFQISQYEQALNGDGNVLGLADVIDQYGKKAYLKIGQLTTADVNADLNQCGLAGSPTKVKAVENIVFKAKESKVLTGSDNDINELVKELMASRTI